MVCGSPRALHLPSGLCACLSPAPPQHSTCGVQEQPLFPFSSSPRTSVEYLPLTLPREAKGRGHLGKAWHRDHEEGTSSSIKCHSHAISSVPKEGAAPSLSPGRGWQQSVPRSLPLSLGSSVQL